MTIQILLTMTFYSIKYIRRESFSIIYFSFKQTCYGKINKTFSLGGWSSGADSFQAEGKKISPHPPAAGRTEDPGRQ